jgi:hypothetical protein
LTLFVIDEFDLLDVVGEPHLSGVVTVRSGSLDSLLPLRMLCPEPPFRPIDRTFRFAIHVPLIAFKLSPFSSMLTPETIEELEYPISPSTEFFRWQGLRADEEHATCNCDASWSTSEDDDCEPEDPVCLESGAGFVWHEDALALAFALESEGWTNVSVFPCYQEIGALKVSSIISGRIETFETETTETDDEFDGPPSAENFFGGDA